MKNLVAINTIEEAIAWGDSWREAYCALRRTVEADIARLEWRILDLETELLVEDCLHTLALPD